MFIRTRYYIDKYLFNKNALLFLLSFSLAAAAFFGIFFYEARLQKAEITKLLIKEEVLIEEGFLTKLDLTYGVIQEMTQQIIEDPYNKAEILKIIKTKENQHNLNDVFPWTIFSWTNSQNQIIVDATYGIMKDPFDLSIRDYIQLTSQTADKFFLGTPVFGSTSKKWMIPGGVGVNLNDQYLGTMTIGFEIEILAKMLHYSIKNRKIKFTLIDLGNLPILYASTNDHGNCREKLCEIDQETTALINQIKFSDENAELIQIKNISGKKAIFLKKLDKYPYIFLLEYDPQALKTELIESYKTKIKIITVFIIFLISLIFSYRLVFI